MTVHDPSIRLQTIDPSGDRRDAESAHRQTLSGTRSTQASLRPLADDLDRLIRFLCASGFTTAAVKSRHDIGSDLATQLDSLIDTLDEAIRGIRRAVTPDEAA
jgi:hypothetical protein